MPHAQQDALVFTGQLLNNIPLVRSTLQDSQRSGSQSASRLLGPNVGYIPDIADLLSGNMTPPACLTHLWLQASHSWSGSEEATGKGFQTQSWIYAETQIRLGSMAQPCGPDVEVDLVGVSGSTIGETYPTLSSSRINRTRSDAAFVFDDNDTNEFLPQTVARGACGAHSTHRAQIVDPLSGQLFAVQESLLSGCVDSDARALLP